MTYEITFAKNNKYIKMIRLQNINLTPPEDIQQLANNHAIAVNLRDTFPYPYKIEDATTFLDLATNSIIRKRFRDI